MNSLAAVYKPHLLILYINFLNHDYFLLEQKALTLNRSVRSLTTRFVLASKVIDPLKISILKGLQRICYH